MSEIILNKDEFENKLNEYYLQHSGNNRQCWNKAKEEKVIKAMSDETKNNFYYHCQKSYELVQIGSITRVIEKRKSDHDPLIYLITREDFYDKLIEAHTSTGHGGRDKMLYYCKNMQKSEDRFK